MNKRTKKKKMKSLLNKYLDNKIKVDTKYHDPCINCKYGDGKNVDESCWDCDPEPVWIEYACERNKEFEYILRKILGRVSIESDYQDEIEEIKMISMNSLAKKYNIFGYYINFIESYIDEEIELPTIELSMDNGCCGTTKNVLRKYTRHLEIKK